MADFAAARHNMVESQIRTNKVTDPAIIAAMEEVPRERFVDRSIQSIAYLDEDLPIGGGRYLMEPMVLARMLQTLEIKPGDVALDIGVATGYSSAVIARLASTVIAVEADGDMVRQATQNLADLGIDNAAVVEGALSAGYPAQAPYDVILFQGSVPELPDGIAEQLAEGGRMCVVVDEGARLGRATLVVRTGGVISHRIAFDANTPLLPGFERKRGFVF